MMHPPSEGEPLLARAVPAWEPEGRALREGARVPRRAAGRTVWHRIPLTFPRNAGSPASIRLRDSLPIICGNCRSDMTNAGSPGILRCAPSLATGNGAETGPLRLDFPSPLDLSDDACEINGGTNGTLRPNVVPGQSIQLSHPSISEWFNTAAFVAPANRAVWRRPAQQHYRPRQQGF